MKVSKNEHQLSAVDNSINMQGKEVNVFIAESHFENFIEKLTNEKMSKYFISMEK
jgi:hypothetical protein